MHSASLVCAAAAKTNRVSHVQCLDGPGEWVTLQIVGALRNVTLEGFYLLVPNVDNEY